MATDEHQTCQQQFLTIVQLSKKSDVFYRPMKSAGSNNFFQPTVQHF